MGKVAPVTENPVPEALALFTVTAEPEALNVSDCVEGVFRSTLPNAMLLELMLSVPPDEDAGFNCRAKVLETPLAVAVSVTDCADVTVETVVENPALAAFAGTVIDAGTWAAALLLERLTATPPDGAAAVRVTVQASVPAADMEPLLQLRPASDGMVLPVPVPLRAIVDVPPVDELLAMVTEPVTSPAALGLN
jgi:hypothetical protein